MGKNELSTYSHLEQFTMTFLIFTATVFIVPKCQNIMVLNDETKQYKINIAFLQQRLEKKDTLYFRDHSLNS